LFRRATRRSRSRKIYSGANAVDDDEEEEEEERPVG
jgi:hypothetical protein